MLRLSAILVVATFAGRHLLSSHAALLPDDPESTRPTADAKASDPQRRIQDVSALVAAVHGLPGVVCGLTAEAAAGWGGRSWMNAPAPPLGPDASERVADFPRARLSLRDVAMLIDSVTSSDACVRELAVRLIGRAPAELVEDRLIARVESSQPAPTREAAVLALGLVESKAGVTPLLRLVMDEGMGVRANAVWALGRIGDRRASAPLRRSLSDQAAVVREAALGALGALEDTGGRSFVSHKSTRAVLRPRADSEAFLAAALPGKSRKEFRRLERRLAESGELRYTAAQSDAEIERWVTEFLSLEAGGWKGARGSAFDCTEGSRSFFSSIAREAARRGRLMMLGLHVGERPVALKCNFLAGQGSFAFKIAYDEAYARYSPGVLLELENIRRLHEGRPLLNLVDFSAGY